MACFKDNHMFSTEHAYYFFIYNINVKWIRSQIPHTPYIYHTDQAMLYCQK